MFKSLFKDKEKYFGVKTFTYYLPSPPHRKSGYQEKEFDYIIEHISSLGFDLLEIKTESHSGEDKSGIWLVCILGAKTEKLFKTSIDIEYQDVAGTRDQNIPLDPSIVHEN